MSSLPWVSVNYFSPLTVGESTEPEMVSDYPFENERNEKCLEVEGRRKEVEGRQTKRFEKAKEGMAEWVLWMMHQDSSRGEKVLEPWTHRGRKSEVMQLQAILEMRTEEGLEAVKEMQGKKQWIRQINNASVMIPTIIETLTDRRGCTMEALLDCGATGCYINEGFANVKNLPMDCLPRPLPTMQMVLGCQGLAVVSLYD